jgi:hypothetical protein
MIRLSHDKLSGMIEISAELKGTYIETANVLKGSERRIFMARIVKALGRGGQMYAERELGWNRRTIRKGRQELESGIRCIDNFQARGRKRTEEHLPNLLSDIRSIVDSQSQTDPTFRTMRLYTRLTAAEVRHQLIEQKGYTDEELPHVNTIGVKLNEMGYRLRTVQKSRPQKNG